MEASFDLRNVYFSNADVFTKLVLNYTEDGFYHADFVVGIAIKMTLKKQKKPSFHALMKLRKL
jgi:hypothetical protein